MEKVITFIVVWAIAIVIAAFRFCYRSRCCCFYVICLL